LAAGKNIDLLNDQIDRFHPHVVSVLEEDDALRLKDIRGKCKNISVLWGLDGYLEIAKHSSTQMVISAMVGAAGLLPTWEAIRSGKDIALANKETLVTAGKLIKEKARECGSKILPIDSEHSAIFQCLEGHRIEFLKRIILTASGGPFLHLPKEDFRNIQVNDALNHPNWKMGKKITIDSASMMNKGLEVIEANWLFGGYLEQIEIIVHPQSIIHSMVEYIDGSIIAQMGIPDMRVPIAYALYYPERGRMPACRLELTECSDLQFVKPDFDKFPNIRLAYEAGRKGGIMPAVLNAANEVAVDKFIKGEIAFTDISLLVDQTMKAMRNREPLTIDEILESDRSARDIANKIGQGIGHVRH
jgi:1-deoxy-D-xylulose-5-phosphate reductoisomerase